MRKEIIDLICSPLTHNELKLKDAIDDNGSIVEGTLLCGDESYQIANGTASLLPYSAELESSENLYERKSVPYDKVLLRKGITAEAIFEMDALRYSISKLIEKHVTRYANGITMDLGAGTNILKSKYEHLAKLWISLDYDIRSDSLDIQGDGQQLPIRNDCIQTIVSIDVLEHVPDPYKMIKEIHRVLAPGGTVILSTPFLFWHHEEPFDFHRFTKYGLRKAFADAELEVLEIDSIAGPIATFSFLLSVLLTKLFSFSSYMLRFVLAVNRFFQVNLILPIDRLFDKSGKMTQGHFIVAKKPRN